MRFGVLLASSTRRKVGIWPPTPIPPWPGDSRRRFGVSAPIRRGAARQPCGRSCAGQGEKTSRQRVDDIPQHTKPRCGATMTTLSLCPTIPSLVKPEATSAARHPFHHRQEAARRDPAPRTARSAETHTRSAAGAVGSCEKLSTADRGRLKSRRQEHL